MKIFSQANAVRFLVGIVFWLSHQSEVICRGPGSEDEDTSLSGTAPPASSSTSETNVRNYFFLNNE